MSSIVLRKSQPFASKFLDTFGEMFPRQCNIYSSTLCLLTRVTNEEGDLKQRYK